jgi:hypothetical protein
MDTTPRSYSTCNVMTHQVTCYFGTCSLQIPKDHALADKPAKRLLGGHKSQIIQHLQCYDTPSNMLLLDMHF